MQIELNYRYLAKVIPWRARKERKYLFAGARPAAINIQEFSEQEAPVAFNITVKDRYAGRYILPIRLHDGKLWKTIRENHSGKKMTYDENQVKEFLMAEIDMPDKWYDERVKEGVPITTLIRSEYREVDDAEDRMLAKIAKVATQYIIVNGVMYHQTTEPRYYVNNLYGRERAVCIETRAEYGYSIRGERELDFYFRADDYAGARALVDRIQETGYHVGDCEELIEVFIPEAVHLDPRADGRAMKAKDNAEKLVALDEKLRAARKELEYLEEERQKIIAGDEA